MSPTRAQVAALVVALSVVAVPMLGVVENELAATESSDPPTAAPGEELEEGIREQVPGPSEDLRSYTKDHSAEGAKVGVIGSEFDPDHVAIEPAVADHYRLGRTGPFRNAEHDTAVAEIVTRTAPGADLYLVAVGSTPTPERYARAIRWLVAHDVDVIVDSGSYFPTVAGDGERVAAAAERATDEGVVFVTSAGNYAGRHWAGEGVSDGWVTFAPDDEANELAGGDAVRGRVSIRLRWNSEADYDLYLYRRLPGRDVVVAESTTREATDGRSIEAIDVAVPRGRYYVAVYAHEGADDPGGIQLFSARHTLEHTTARGSMVAPATSEAVITVGALAENGTAAYSSRGDDGTTDLTAPGSFDTRASGAMTGTSAAAPYVAGTAAVVASGDDDLTPSEVEAILESSSDENGVETAAAVDAAENRTADATNDTDSDGAEGANGPRPDGASNASRANDGERKRPDERERNGTTGRPDGGTPGGRHAATAESNGATA